MFPAIAWKKTLVVMIDQRKLPGKEIYVKFRTSYAVADAIKKLLVRGAPAIGVAAAYGVALAGLNSKAKDFSGFSKDLKPQIKVLRESRPTAVNLFWALDRMEKFIKNNSKKPVQDLKRLLLNEAKLIEKEDVEMNRKMAKNGSKLFKNNSTIMTICNTGALATAGIGTAFGVIRETWRTKKNIKVIACETRPVLQGARLTAWELKKAKIPFRLITDGMAAFCMKKGMVDAVITGADRITANGDTANKIGTYMLAVLAKYHKIPFYVAAPSSTIDLKLRSGSSIPIEERKAEEITKVLGTRIAPKGIKVFNPAFDYAPNELISGIITEKKVFKKPFSRTLRT